MKFSAYNTPRERKKEGDSKSKASSRVTVAAHVHETTVRALLIFSASPILFYIQCSRRCSLSLPLSCVKRYALSLISLFLFKATGIVSF